MRALTPSTAGDCSAVSSAWPSGRAGGLGSEPEAAIATPAPRTTTATAPARARRRRWEMRDMVFRRGEGMRTPRVLWAVRERTLSAVSARQVQREARPVGADAALLAAGDRADDRQPEPRARGAGVGPAPEALERVVGVRCREALALVGDGEHRTVAVGAGGHRDPPLGRPVAARVAHEATDRALERRALAAHERLPAGADDGGALDRVGRGRVLGQRDDVADLRPRRRRRGLAREREEVVEQRAQA